MTRGFKDQTTKIESQSERVTQEHGFCSVAQSKRRRVFELSAGLGGIATLRIGLSADAQLPSIRTNLHVTRQANGTIRQVQVGGKRKTKAWSVIRVGERTS